MGEPETEAEDESVPGGVGLGVDALFVQVYDRLRAMASRQALAPGATLQTTALVHELYLRLQRGRELEFEAPGQFFAYAGRAMRHLVADRARERLALKAGGAWDSVTLDDRAALPSIDSAEEALALDEALVALEKCNARAAQVVELRYFAGLSVDEMADALGLNRRTLHRDWRFARAFLNARLA